MYGLCEVPLGWLGRGVEWAAAYYEADLKDPAGQCELTATDRGVQVLEMWMDD